MFLFQVFFSEEVDNDGVKQDAGEPQNSKRCISSNVAKNQFEQIKQADRN